MKLLTTTILEKVKSDFKNRKTVEEALSSIDEYICFVSLCDPKYGNAERNVIEGHVGVFLRELLRTFERKVMELSPHQGELWCILSLNEPIYTFLAERLLSDTLPSALPLLEKVLRERILPKEASKESDIASLLREAGDVIDILTADPAPTPFLFTLIAVRLAEAYGLSAQQLVLLKCLHLINESISSGVDLGEGCNEGLVERLDRLICMPLFQPLRWLLVVLISSNAAALPWSNRRGVNLAGIIKPLSTSSKALPADPGVRYICDTALFDAKLQRTLAEILVQSLATSAGIAFMEAAMALEVQTTSPLSPDTASVSFDKGEEGVLWMILTRVYGSLRAGSYDESSDADIDAREDVENRDRISRVANALARLKGKSPLKILQPYLLCLELDVLKNLLAERPALLPNHINQREREGSILQGYTVLILLLKSIFKGNRGVITSAQIDAVPTAEARLVTIFHAFKLLFLKRSAAKKTGFLQSTKDSNNSEFLCDVAFIKDTISVLLASLTSTAGVAEGEDLMVATSLTKVLVHALERFELAERGAHSECVITRSLQSPTFFLSASLREGDEDQIARVMTIFTHVAPTEPPKDNTSYCESPLEGGLSSYFRNVVTEDAPPLLDTLLYEMSRVTTTFTSPLRNPPVSELLDKSLRKGGGNSDCIPDGLPVAPFAEVAEEGLKGCTGVKDSVFTAFRGVFGKEDFSVEEVEKIVAEIGGEGSICGGFMKYLSEGVEVTKAGCAAEFLAVSPENHIREQVFVEENFDSAQRFVELTNDDLMSEVFAILCKAHETPDAFSPHRVPHLRVPTLIWVNDYLQEQCKRHDTEGVPGLPIIAAAILLRTDETIVDTSLLSYFAKVAANADLTGTKRKGDGMGFVDRWLAGRLMVLEDFVRRHSIRPRSPGSGTPSDTPVAPLDAEQLPNHLNPDNETAPHPTHTRKIALLRGEGRGVPAPPQGSLEVLGRIEDIMQETLLDDSTIIEGYLGREVEDGAARGGVCFYRREAERYKFSVSVDEALACVAFGDLTPEGASATALVDATNLLLRTAQQLQAKAEKREKESVQREGSSTPASSPQQKSMSLFAKLGKRPATSHSPPPENSATRQNLESSFSMGSDPYTRSAKLLIRRAAEFLVRVGSATMEGVGSVVHDFLLSPRYRNVLTYDILGDVLKVVPEGFIHQADGLRQSVDLYKRLLADDTTRHIMRSIRRFPELLTESHPATKPLVAPPALRDLDITQYTGRPANSLLTELLYAVETPELCLEVLKGCFEYSLDELPQGWRDLARLWHGTVIGEMSTVGDLGGVAEYLEEVDVVWGDGEAREVCLGFAACPEHSSEDKEIIAGMGGVQHEVHVGLSLIDSLGDHLNSEVLTLVKRPDVLAEQLLRDGNVYCVHRALKASPDEVLPLRVLDFYARKSMACTHAAAGGVMSSPLTSATPAFDEVDCLRAEFVYSQAPCLPLCKSLLAMIADHSAAAQTCLEIASAIDDTILHDIAAPRGRKWGIVAIEDLCGIARERLGFVVASDEAAVVGSQITACDEMLAAVVLLKKIELEVGHRYDFSAAVEASTEAGGSPEPSPPVTPRRPMVTPRGKGQTMHEVAPVAMPETYTRAKVLQNKILLFATLAVEDLEDEEIVSRVIETLVAWDRVELAAEVARTCGVSEDTVWIAACKHALLLGWWETAWEHCEKVSREGVAASLDEIHELLEGPPIQRHAMFNADTGNVVELAQTNNKELKRARYKEALKYTTSYGTDEHVMSFYVSREDITRAVAHAIEKDLPQHCVKRIFLPAQARGVTGSLRSAMLQCDETLLSSREMLYNICQHIRSTARDAETKTKQISTLAEAAEWQQWMGDHVRCAFSHIESFSAMFSNDSDAKSPGELSLDTESNADESTTTTTATNAFPLPGLAAFLPMMTEGYHDDGRVHTAATSISLVNAFFAKLTASLEAAHSSLVAGEKQPFVQGDAVSPRWEDYGYEGTQPRCTRSVLNERGISLPPTALPRAMLAELVEKVQLQAGVVRIYKDQLAALLKAGGDLASLPAFIPSADGRLLTLFNGPDEQHIIAEQILSLDFTFGFQLVRQLDVPRAPAFRSAVMTLSKKRDEKRLEATLRQMNNTLPAADLDAIVLECITEVCRVVYNMKRGLYCNFSYTVLFGAVPRGPYCRAFHPNAVVAKPAACVRPAALQEVEEGMENKLHPFPPYLKCCDQRKRHRCSE